MATGDYKLVKTNSDGTFDEKTITAENGKTLSFNSDLYPVMLTKQNQDDLLDAIAALNVTGNGGLIKAINNTTVSVDGAAYCSSYAVIGDGNVTNLTYTTPPDNPTVWAGINFGINLKSLLFQRGPGVKLEIIEGIGALIEVKGLRISIKPDEIDMITQKTSVVIDKDEWTQGATYKEYVITDTDILAGSFVQIIPANASYNVIMTAQILPTTTVAAGSVTIYAINVPTADITVSYNISQ